MRTHKKSFKLLKTRGDIESFFVRASTRLFSMFTTIISYKLKGLLSKPLDINWILGPGPDSLDLSLIFFDKLGNLVAVNKRAHLILPQLRSSTLPASQSLETIDNLKKFITFVFDHSIDPHMQTHLFWEKEGRYTTIFREIIQLQNNQFFIIRAIPQVDGATLVDMTDITDIKQNADHLFYLGQHNKILAEAIQTSRDGIFIADNTHPGKKILFVNQALSLLLNRDCEEIVGYSSSIIFSQEFPREFQEIQNILNSNTTGTVWSYREIKQGIKVWLELHLITSGVNGNLLIGFVADRTQERQQDARLRQTQRLEAIGQLVGGIAHDFNNILAIIEGYAHMSQTGIKRGENIVPKLDKILHATQRGSGLTRQLLTFGKHRITEHKTIDICSVVRDVQGLLHPLLGVSIKLKMHVEDGPIYIKATPDIVTQIVMNLCINARDAMKDDGGEICLIVQESANSKSIPGCYLKIKDTGCGMSREVMDRIFDPFFTTKEQGKGTGLGLSMVYGLVQQLKGEISVDSTPRAGTCFSIWIPQSDTLPENTIEAANTINNNDVLKGKTVVVAEDEPDLLEIMQTTLEDFGMTVLTAHNGNEALEVQDTHDGEIDFLLTDMVMPELGGVHLAELFHEIRPNTHIVFMSGYPVRGEISTIDLPEDAVFMAKPVLKDNLKSIMENLCRGESAQAQSRWVETTSPTLN